MDTLVDTFVSLTNASSLLAREYLALARDDLDRALTLWFDQGVTNEHYVGPTTKKQAPVKGANELLAEILSELSTTEGDINEVGQMVRGLERNPSPEYILSISSSVEKCLKTAEEDLMQKLLKCDGLEGVREQRRAAVITIQGLQSLLDGHLVVYNEWKLGVAKL
eukprot:TRINITY_DN2829_c0_g1_i1.p1 TRINITY_DN2829_c0_g1~~TRINITY_DN2829_c0_g1_i1.p1  ORF type:complete len:165 (+),score=33.88 TRINITY_DN2829_c0_g1_i1:14-508(+)